MRTLLAILAFMTLASVAAATNWTPDAWHDENTVELRTTEPGAEAHWSPVWLVVIDGQLYVRLGSRAAERFDRTVPKAVLGVRIAGKTFERVNAIAAPDMVDRVTAAMADKYWLQGDVIVRHISHPYTLRLEPAASEPAP